jgi:hypothetical protein
LILQRSRGSVCPFLGENRTNNLSHENRKHRRYSPTVGTN